MLTEALLGPAVSSDEWGSPVSGRESLESLPDLNLSPAEVLGEANHGLLTFVCRTVVDQEDLNRFSRFVAKINFLVLVDGDSESKVGRGGPGLILVHDEGAAEAGRISRDSGKFITPAPANDSFVHEELPREG